MAGLAATVKSASATKIVLNAAGSDKKVDEGDVVIVSNTGATVSKAKAWSYFTPGAILKVEPAKGQKGTKIVITGNADAFFGDSSAVAKVTLAGIEAQVTAATRTEVQLVAGSLPSDSTSTEVVGAIIITSKTGITVTKEKAWTFHPNWKIIVCRTANRCARHRGVRLW